VSALVDIPDGTVYNHNAEEDRVEPRERALKSSNQAPRDSEEHIAAIMDLAG
jgi:hypothetical protein